MDAVRIRNVGKAPIQVAYNSQVTILPVDTDAFMEREAAAIHFGNWTLSGAEREAEYKRLRGLGGSDKEGRSAMEDDAVWDLVRPRVEIYELSGERITTILDDPAGHSITYAKPLDYDAQLAALQDQVNRLMKERESDMALVPVSQVGEDKPETATRRRSREPSVRTEQED